MQLGLSGVAISRYYTFMKSLPPPRQAGFTLPELLVAFLLVTAVGVTAMFLLRENPRTTERNNYQRKTAEAALIQGISRYYYDNGSLPDGLTTSYQNIGSESGQYDLCKRLVPDYIYDMVYDPTSGMVTQDGRCNAKDQRYYTGYSIKRSDDGKSVSIVSTTAEGGKVILYTKSFK